MGTKQKMLAQAQKSGQSAVRPLLVVHKVKHLATSMHVMMYFDSSAITHQHHRCWLFKDDRSLPTQSALIGDTNNSLCTGS